MRFAVLYGRERFAVSVNIYKAGVWRTPFGAREVIDFLYRDMTIILSVKDHKNFFQ